MFEILGTLLSGVLSGGATGLLGVLFQRYFDFKAKGQEIQIVAMNLANAIEVKKLEGEQLLQQIAGRLKVTEAEVAGHVAVAQEERAGVEAQARAEEIAAEAEAEAKMYQASVDNDAAHYLDKDAQKNWWAALMMGMVDWLRGMTRPVLTCYLIILTHIMFNWARELAAKHGEVMTPADLKQIIMVIVTTILYLATVATVWWFGTRPPKAPNSGK